MVKKITALTDEQAARFAEWRQKWIDIGLSTEPADFARAEAAALRIYDMCKLARPFVVLRVGSPFAATLAGAMAWKILRGLFADKVASQVASQVRSRVWSQVWSQVESQVESQVASQVASLNFKEASEGFSNYRGAQFWASWGAYISFFKDVMGWENEMLFAFKDDEELMMSCGWGWWHENVLVISDRPRVLRRDAEGRLHGENGPSIAYPDGWSLHHWHGTAVPSEWIENRSSLTPQIALSWENVEQRRAACEMLGWNNILSALDAKIIDADADQEIGTLVEVSLPDAGREKFLRVRCGTGREFALPVPPEMNTALQANAWTYGFDDYKKFFKPEIRT